jgi:threonylcarbamoyladenosine tRNA methylthiotransferase MtaB
MVGFPGETESVFEQCWGTVRSLPLGCIHVFSFSPRPGTTAAALSDRVPAAAVRSRRGRMLQLAREKAEAFAQCSVGAELEVLTEGCRTPARLEGWSDNYLRVTVLPDATMHAQPNQLVRVRIDAAKGGRAVVGTAVSLR